MGVSLVTTLLNPPSSKFRKKPYDLCMSLEVAEHLPPQQAENFIKYLCSQSDLVLFSAATFGQGGTCHINEQWQSYWVHKFLHNTFECYDIFRKRFWYDPLPGGAWWYIQNIFLFVNAKRHDLSTIGRKLNDPMPYDVIHPCARKAKIALTDQDKEIILMWQLMEKHYRQGQKDRAEAFARKAFEALQIRSPHLFNNF